MNAASFWRNRDRRKIAVVSIHFPSIDRFNTPTEAVLHACYPVVGIQRRFALGQPAFPERTEEPAGYGSPLVDRTPKSGVGSGSRTRGGCGRGPVRLVVESDPGVTPSREKKWCWCTIGVRAEKESAKKMELVCQLLHRPPHAVRFSAPTVHVFANRQEQSPTA